MTRDETGAQAHLADHEAEHGAERGSHALPLVSVVVVNYNYGRFLDEAIDSVFAQTYPRIECLVVDNASTDGSDAVIAGCVARHPELRVLRRDGNGGQTAACLDGLAKTRGPFVVFLDADDYLLPPCIETHIAVHLSSRVHVGFTSADMLQVADGQVVASVNDLASAFARENRDGPVDLLRPHAAVPGGLEAMAAALAGRVALVPRTRVQWVWAPTSGNCFRRDALDLVCDAEGLTDLRAQTDLFLAVGINVLCGSILIDEPLFVYRFHSANVFSHHVQLQGFLNFDVSRGTGLARMARRLVIDHLVTHIERFVQEPWMIWHVFDILKRLDDTVEEKGAWHGRSYAARAVARRYEAVHAVAGAKPLRDFILPRAPWTVRARLLMPKRRAAS